MCFILGYKVLLSKPKLNTKFEVIKNYNAAKKQLNISVIQKQTKDSISEYRQVAFFKGKIDIEIEKVRESINKIIKSSDVKISNLYALMNQGYQ